MPIDYDDKGRRFTRDSEKDAKYQTGSGKAGTGVQRSAAGLGSVAKARPKLPRRTDFSSEEAYNKAYRSYREAMLGDTDNLAQKKALSRMK